ncbi:PPE domain-containing protein [Allokutzneria oryzae]|uniref:PPE domain-containing protein n=1 Tax=Allokutzneria oryzae TaxID=1378989 RepID=A0ABV5ZZV4_9PSEU
MAIPHEQLYKDIRSGFGVAAAEPSRAFYHKLFREYVDARDDLAKGLQALGAAWGGLAADNARASIGRFGPWSEVASSSAIDRRNATERQSSHYTRARDSMPEPKRVTAMPDNTVIRGLANFFGITTDRQVQEKAAHEAHVRAVEVMRSYARSSQETTSGFPVFAPPPQIGIEVPDAPAPAPTPPIGGTPPVRHPKGGRIDDSGRSTSHQQDGGVVDQHRRDPGQSDPVRRGDVEQQGFRPSPTDPVPLPSPRDGGVGGGGYSGSGVGGFAGGVAGLGGRLGGSGGGGGGAVRGGQPGTGAGRGSGAAAPIAPSTARNVAGKPGQSFMQPALPSSQREEDGEHKRKYSVTDDLVGELPKVAPPVIGE